MIVTIGSFTIRDANSIDFNYNCDIKTVSTDAISNINNKDKLY